MLHVLSGARLCGSLSILCVKTVRTRDFLTRATDDSVKLFLNIPFFKEEIRLFIEKLTPQRRALILFSLKNTQFNPIKNRKTKKIWAVLLSLLPFILFNCLKVS